MNAYQIGLTIRMNIRYHDRRIAFLQTALRLEKFVIVASVTATIAALKQSMPSELTYFFAGLAALLTVSLLVIDADEAFRAHKELSHRWRAARKLYELSGGELATDDQIHDVRNVMADIEVDEMPVNTARLRLAQNEILQQTGETWRIKQSWLHRHLAQFIDLDRDTPAQIIDASNTAT
jgi:hypothetical protein